MHIATSSLLVFSFAASLTSLLIFFWALVAGLLDPAEDLLPVVDERTFDRRERPRSAPRPL